MSLSKESNHQPPPVIRLLGELEAVGKTRWQQFWAEPFRPFFLLGWAISLVGLGLWPLYFAGATERFPGPTHAYLMVQGFFGAFAIGFLWTAMPRMLEVPGPDRRWVAAGLLLIGGAVSLHLAGFHPPAHLFFLALFVLFAVFAIRRFPARRDLPPPSFVLVLTGVGGGVIGTALVAAGEAGWLTGFGYRLGRLLLLEFSLLFLVMGVAAFLAPRFLGKASRQSMPTSRLPSKKWMRQAALAGAAAAVLLTGAALQAGGMVRAGALFAAVPATAYILYQVPVFGRAASFNWMAVGLRISLLCSMAGPWVRLILPDARVASTHLLLLGGFGLLTLIVGARVTFGHSGYGHLFRTRLDTIGVIVGLYTASLGGRLAGEAVPAYWLPLVLTSALLLVAAHVVWAFLIVPKIFRPRQDQERTTNSAQSPPIDAGRILRGYGKLPVCAKTESRPPMPQAR